MPQTRRYDIRSRKCKSCDRVFSKPEHLKRHQRSHTGERPFKCEACGRTYARRDVLTRHIRNHHTALGNDDGEKGEPFAKTPSVSPEAIDSGHDGESESNEPQGTGWEPSQKEASRALEASPSDSTFALPHDHGNLHQQNVHAGLNSNAGIEGQTQLSPSIVNSHQILDSFGDFNNPFVLGLPTGSDHFDLQDQISSIDPALLESLLQIPSPVDQTVRERQNDGISHERLEQIRRFWPTRRRTENVAPSKIRWDDILLHPESNLFSSSSLKDLATMEPADKLESVWGFTESCRNRLVQECSSFSQKTTTSEPTDYNDGVSPSAQVTWDGELPPADILDLGLDLYFYHFHVSLPIIHAPTFKAVETPSALLFFMCLVGLMIFNRKAAHTLVKKYITGAIHDCRVELSSKRLRHCAAPELLVTLARACLLLFVAASTAEIAFEEERQALCEETMSLARQRGLLDTPNYNPALTQGLIDEDSNWKAWARVQSAERIIAALILTDAYSAHVLGIMPILCPEELRTPILCPDPLFSVYTSKKWKTSLGACDPWALIHKSQDNNNQPIQLTGFGLQAALGCAWTRILHARHQLLPAHAEEYAPQTQSLCDVISTSSTARSIPQELILAFHTNQTEFTTGNANSIILWHLLGLSLTTNMSTIEIAAGRDGSIAAKQAVESLATWAKTPAARRACLHAAQILVVMKRQKRSDGIMLHSETALFSAALVMGLYLLTTPESVAFDDSGYDLLEEVDWELVAGEGLDSRLSSSSDCHAVEFIRTGGPVCFSGARFHTCYGLARRTFMNFAAQLDEVGRWNVGEYCKVLRIISDTLIGSDGGGD